MMEATATKMKCVACGHENQATDNACAACGSTLNLRVCPACEAINNQSAQKCHACGAAFAEGPATVIEETVRAAPGEIPGRIGRMPMLFEQMAAPRPAYRMARMAIVVVPLLALGYGAGYFYRGKSATPIATDKQTDPATPKVVQRDSSTVTAQSDAAAPKAVVSGTAEGKITGVTHLRRGDAPVAAAAAAPVPVRVEPKPAKPAAPVAPERTATIPGPAPTQSHFVTHTRAPRTAVPPTPTPPTAAASTAAAVVAPASACAESVAALGLCKADSKGEGK
jgi:hypothetical protein